MSRSPIPNSSSEVAAAMTQRALSLGAALGDCDAETRRKAARDLAAAAVAEASAASTQEVPDAD